MNIIITGSEGNVGTELVPYLKSMGHEVLCLDIMQKFRKNYILCDVRNLSDAEKEISEFKPDAVFHLAAMVSRITCEKSPTLATDVNLNGTMNIAQLCKRHGAKLINFSTSEVYGNQNIELEEDIDLNPNNIYGLTKKMAEELIEYESKNHGLEYINVRPFMMYSEHENMGENRSAMIRFAEGVVNRTDIEVHIGAKRSWLHMSDAVVIFERLLHVKGNHTVNVGNSDFIDIEYMADFMCEYAGSPKYIINKMRLPERMTLKKVASFKRQAELTGYSPKIPNEVGMRRVIDIVKKKLIAHENIGSNSVL